jgi:uncharacterized protein with NRDE domain
MCTVSWLYEDGGYQLFSNRDERHTRKPALPPRIDERRGVQFIAPLDGEHGGSWIGVNQFGLSLCLLNRYYAETAAGQSYTSRGLLLTELLACRSRAQVQSRIGQMELTRFQPFTLLALEPEPTAFVWQWTGSELMLAHDAEAMLPLISSAYDLPQVNRARRQYFNDLVAQAGKLEAQLLYSFHTSHVPVASAYSTCMHRQDARTVSFSTVKVARGAIEFFYHPAAPCLLPRSLNNLKMEPVKWKQ